jgi:hypothetical protein
MHAVARKLEVTHMVLKHEGVEFVLLQPPFYEHHLETRLHRTMAVTTETLLA